MDFEQIHKIIYPKIKDTIRIYDIGRISPDDVINDVFIKLFEKGAEITEKSMMHESNLMLTDLRYNLKEARKYEWNTQSSLACVGCQEEIPAAFFSICTRKRTGERQVMNRCRACQAKRVQEYRKSANYKEWRVEYYERNKETIDKKNKRIYELKKNTREYKDRNAQLQREHYQRNKEKMREYHRERNKRRRLVNKLAKEFYAGR